MQFRASAIGILVTLSLTNVSYGTNILVGNSPSFEAGNLPPWVVISGSPQVTPLEHHFGFNAAAELAGDTIKQNFFAVPTSEITEVSFWVKHAVTVHNGYSYFYDDASVDNFILDAPGTGDWQFFDITSNLAAGKNLTGFSISGTSPGPAYLDDFVINQVPEPSTLALCAMVAGCVFVVSRRNR